MTGMAMMAKLVMRSLSGTILWLAMGFGGSTLCAEDAVPPLELKVVPKSAISCPLDPIEVNVEFHNRSNGDIVVSVPDRCGGGLHLLQIRPQNGKWLEFDMAAGFLYGENVTLHAGESRTSATLLIDDTGMYPLVPEGKYEIGAHYAAPIEHFLPQFPDRKLLTPIEVTSPVAVVQLKWCDPSVPAWLEKMDAAKGELADQHNDGFDHLADIERAAPPCARRAAYLSEISLRFDRAEGERCFEIAKTLWADASGGVERDRVAYVFDRLVNKFGRREDIEKMVEGYKSAAFGDLPTHWKEMEELKAREEKKHPPR